MRLIWCLPLLCLNVAALAAPAAPARTSAADLKTRLSRAIAANDASAVARLMKRGARPDDSTLELAVYGTTMTTWRALFDGGLSVNARVGVSEEAGLGNNAPLIVVIAAGAGDDGTPDNQRRALLREFIARGADVNARAHNGYTALQVAAYQASDDGQAAQILLDAGARVRPDDARLLVSAARLNKVALLRRARAMGVRADSQAARGQHLLQQALDIRGQSLNEDTPVLEAKDAAARAQIVAILLDVSAPINDLDELGQTPIMLAADGSLRPELVELLLKRGADVKARKPSGPTIWDYAMPLRFYTKAQIELMLATNGDEPVLMDTATSQALVAKIEDTRTLELLIGAGAPLEQTNARGQTPLMLAAQNNRAKTIAVLAARGAGVNATDKNGETALHIAAGADSPDAVAALSDAGANIEARDQNGLTPLLIAAGAGMGGATYYAPLSMTIDGFLGGPEALRALLARGADAKAKATDAKSATALHYVAKQGDTKSAQLLVRSGADVNARADKGVTALHIAVDAGDYSMCKLLLQLGADARLKAGGKTALDIAREPYITKMNFVGEDPKHPSRETRELVAQLAKSDAQITARRQQIAGLLQRSAP